MGIDIHALVIDTSMQGIMNAEILIASMQLTGLPTQKKYILTTSTNTLLSLALRPNYRLSTKRTCIAP